MPDIFLRQGEPNPNDIVLRDPTFVTSDISLAAGDQSISTSAPLATLVIGALALLAGAATVNASAPTATLVPTVVVTAGQSSVSVSAPAATLAAGVRVLTAGNQSVTVSAPAATLAIRVAAGTPAAQVSAPTATIATSGVSLVYFPRDGFIPVSISLRDHDVEGDLIRDAFDAGLSDHDENRYFWSYDGFVGGESGVPPFVAISLRNWWLNKVVPFFTAGWNAAAWPPLVFDIQIGQDTTANAYYLYDGSDFRDWSLTLNIVRWLPGPGGGVVDESGDLSYFGSFEHYPTSWSQAGGAGDYPVIIIRSVYQPHPQDDYFEIYFNPDNPSTGNEGGGGGPSDTTQVILTVNFPSTHVVLISAPTAVISAVFPPQSLSAGTPSAQVSAPTATLVTNVQLQTTQKFWLLPAGIYPSQGEIDGTAAVGRLALDLQDPVDEGFSIYLGDQPVYFSSDYIGSRVVRADVDPPAPWPTAFWRLYLRHESIDPNEWIAPAIHLLRVGENNEIIEEHNLPIDLFTDNELRASGLITWSTPTGAEIDRIAISIIADPDLSIATLSKSNEADPNWLESDIADAYIEVSAPTATLNTTRTLAAGNQTVTVSAPAATLVSAVSVAAGLTSAQVSAPAATLVVSGVTIGAGAASVSTSAPAATLSTAVTLSAGAASITLTAPIADLSAETSDKTLSAGASSVMASAPGAQLVPGAITFDIPDNAPVIEVSAPDADTSLSFPLNAGGNTVQVIAPAAVLEQGEPPDDQVVGPPPVYPYVQPFTQEEATYAGLASLRFGFEDRVTRTQVNATAAGFMAAPRGAVRAERVTVPLVDLTAAPGGAVQQERGMAAVVSTVRVVPSGLVSREASPDAAALTLRAVNESAAVSGSRKAALLADDEDLLLITEVL